MEMKVWMQLRRVNTWDPCTLTIMYLILCIGTYNNPCFKAQGSQWTNLGITHSSPPGVFHLVMKIKPLTACQSMDPHGLLGLSPSSCTKLQNIHFQVEDTIEVWWCVEVVSNVCGLIVGSSYSTHNFDHQIETKLSSLVSNYKIRMIVISTFKIKLRCKSQDVNMKILFLFKCPWGPPNRVDTWTRDGVFILCIYPNPSWHMSSHSSFLI